MIWALSFLLPAFLTNREVKIDDYVSNLSEPEAAAAPSLFSSWLGFFAPVGFGTFNDCNYVIALIELFVVFI